MSLMSATQRAAERVLAATRYVVLATADADGRPWATPVWFARDARRILWVSDPSARHSRNIAARADIALVVFDSQVPVGGASAYYARARAEEVPPAEVDDGIAVFNRASVAQGMESWRAADVSGAARLHLYRATVEEQWVLAEDGGPDRRLSVG